MKMTSNSFLKIMMKFNFTCDVAAMVLVKLDFIIRLDALDTLDTFSKIV